MVCPRIRYFVIDMNLKDCDSMPDVMDISPRWAVEALSPQWIWGVQQWRQLQERRYGAGACEVSRPLVPSFSFMEWMEEQWMEKQLVIKPSSENMDPDPEPQDKSLPEVPQPKSGALWGDERIYLIPIKENDKSPAVKWEVCLEEKYPRMMINLWYGNFAAVCGKESNNLVVVDIEDPEMYEYFFKDIPTCTVRTPSGGYHIHLFSQNVPGKEQKYLGYPINIPGEGSYALIPPSSINGVKYELVKDAGIMEVEDVLQMVNERLPKRRQRAGIIEKLKEATDIPKVFEHYVGRKIEGKGYWRGNCPFCPDEHPSFTVYGDHFYCYECRARGDVIDFIQMIERTDFWGAVEKLEEMSGVKLLGDVIKVEKKNDITPNVIADLLCALYHFKTFRDTEEVLVYRDGVYQNGGESFIKSEVERIMKKEGSSRKCTMNFVNEVIGHIRRSTYVERSEFNTHRDIVNCRNGLVNIKTLELTPHSPDLLSTIQLPVDYNPEAKCPEIQKFLREVVEEENVHVLEEFAGHCLYLGYLIHKAGLLVGETDSGKSIFIELLRRFLGMQNCTAKSLQDLINNRFARASLYGKLLNAFSELSYKKIDDSGIFKALTGGDRISAERKYKDPFEFYNFAKLLFSANAIPPTSDWSDAFFNRWLIVQFPNRFTGKEKDPNLIEKLTRPEELSGFLNIAIRGLRRLLEQGRFSSSESIEDTARTYTLLSNPVARFLEECCEFGPEFEVKKWDLYNAYVEFCKSNGILPYSQRRFTDMLKEYFTQKKYELGDTRHHGDSKRTWVGLKLKGEESK